MAKVVIRCQYTGNYVFTGLDTQNVPNIVGGRVYCPYCAAEHVWTCTEARHDEPRKRTFVRQAS
jgi:hypothetical protein